MNANGKKTSMGDRNYSDFRDNVPMDRPDGPLEHSLRSLENTAVPLDRPSGPMERMGSASGRVTAPLERFADPLGRSAGNQEIEVPDDMPVDPAWWREQEEKDRLMIAIARYGAAYTGFVPEPIDVAALRLRLQMTRTEFARRFGFPVETLRHWERGDRKPRRGALVALNLIERNSMLALRILRKRLR